MTTVTDELSVATQIATKAHEGQKDKVGVDYILHPLTVSSYCKTERGKIAAVLHDVVEDTDVTLDDLRAAGIGEDVVAAVDCLTWRSGEALEDYFCRIVPNDIAVEVKFADMRHNGDAARWPDDMRDRAVKGTKKYEERIRRLFQSVGSERVAGLLSKETYDRIYRCVERGDLSDT